MKSNYNPAELNLLNCLVTFPDQDTPKLNILSNNGTQFLKSILQLKDSERHINEVTVRQQALENNVPSAYIDSIFVDEEGIVEIPLREAIPTYIEQLDESHKKRELAKLGSLLQQTHKQNRPYSEYIKVVKNINDIELVTKLQHNEGKTAAEIMAMDFPEPKWAVPGLLPVGLNLLVGKPKQGKSWLALDNSVAIAHGCLALGQIQVAKGTVLYLALEDTHQRLKQRLSKILMNQSPSDNLYFYTHWKKLNEGGKADLVNFLKKHSDIRLVVIDTFQKIRRPAKGNNVYQEDYQAIADIKEIADQFDVCILVIHHLRKAGSMDPLEEVSGSTGITGAADTIAVLRRGRNEADAVLHIHGRDVEDSETALQWSKEFCTWSILGDAKDYTLSKERREILDTLDETEPMTPKEVAEVTNKNRGTVRRLLMELKNNEQVIKIGDGYIKVKKTNEQGEQANSGKDYTVSVHAVRPVQKIGEQLKPSPVSASRESVRPVRTGSI